MLQQVLNTAFSEGRQYRLGFIYAENKTTTFYNVERQKLRLKRNAFLNF